MNVTAKVRLSSKTTKGEFLRETSAVPNRATMSIRHYPGDPRDQRETGYTEITFSWDINDTGSMPGSRTDYVREEGWR